MVFIIDGCSFHCSALVPTVRQILYSKLLQKNPLMKNMKNVQFVGNANLLGLKYNAEVEKILDTSSGK